MLKISWSNALVYASSNNSTIAMVKNQQQFDDISDYIDTLNLNNIVNAGDFG